MTLRIRLRRLVPALAAALALHVAAAREARAVVFANDVVPAATLLLPYFEVSLDDPNGATTVFTVANASKDPHPAHVTLWTDLGVPTYAFDVYLAGHDVAEIDLRLVLSGVVPRTSATVTASGTHANPPVEFPNCAALAGVSRLPPDLIESLRAAHTGAAAPLMGGLCAGRPVGDQRARGYVTVDVVNRCSGKFPGDPASGGDPAYFEQLGTGIASNANVLWGEFWFMERAQRFGFGDSLVHLEANGPPFPNNLTFYGRRVAGSMADNREPLPSVYMGRYVNGGAFDATHALVWRDPGTVSPFTCGTAPPRLQQRDVTPFDERENATDLTDGFPIGFQSRFPWAAERVDLSDPARIPIPESFGFLFVNFNFPVSVTDPLFGGRNQAHLTMVFRANGRFAGAVPGWQAIDTNEFFPTP